MKVIDQSCQWLQPPPDNTLELIERAGRTCYKSEDKITPGSAEAFVKRILESHHESVIEHVSASMLFITDRGVSHEIVRHRLASYSQESTRYCNYCKDKFGNEITVIRPIGWTENKDLQYHVWYDSCASAEAHYTALLRSGATAQEARSVLPNSLKTEIVMTANMREWRHFFKMRTSQAAHPQMRALAFNALPLFRAIVPVLFDEYLP